MEIVIHSKPNCIYCDKTKNLLKSLNIPFEEKKYDSGLEEDNERKQKLLNVTNWKTFPQIFIDNSFIGGYTELVKYLSENKNKYQELSFNSEF
jgi:glutaredoxin 3